MSNCWCAAIDRLFLIHTLHHHYHFAKGVGISKTSHLPATSFRCVLLLLLDVEEHTDKCEVM